MLGKLMGSFSRKGISSKVGNLSSRRTMFEREDARSRSVLVASMKRPPEAMLPCESENFIVLSNDAPGDGNTAVLAGRRGLKL